MSVKRWLSGRGGGARTERKLLGVDELRRCSLALCSLAMIGSVSSQTLPQWSVEDQALLKKGQLVAGASLLVDEERAESGEEGDESQPVALVDVIDAPVDNIVELENRVIPEGVLGDYFDQKGATYLIDPQRLFTNQETLDREGFLKYYADESEVDVRIYLFDAQQEIPEPYSLHRLVEEQYAEGPLTAVVFYFLGNPGRNQLLFGGEGADQVKAMQLRKMLESASIQALEKSEPTAQMESFVVQLSISIYWMEQAILDARKAAEAALVSVGGDSREARLEDQEKVSKTQQLWLAFQPYVIYTAVGLGSVLLVAGALIKGWLMWKRSRKYLFPVLDVPPRLGADYAAGVGSVIGFHNKLDSPSAQKDQIPEYLTKL